MGERQQLPTVAARSNLFAWPSPVEYAALAHTKFVYQVPTTGYFFAANHCWLCGDASNVRIGLSDYLQQSLGDLLFFTPVPVGTAVARGDTLATLESHKTTLELASPVAGKVVAVNEATVAMPELINEDPYQNGWLLSLEPLDWAADASALLAGPDYVRELGVWLAGAEVSPKTDDC